jgi:hypothetical protein
LFPGGLLTVVFDPWPDEPDEPTPESRWGNPERDLPRVPEVETEESDVDPHVFKTFWVSVVFANVALFGVSLGAMLWYFRGQALLGGTLVGVGVLAGLRTYASYRAFRTDDGDGDGDRDGDTASPAADGGSGEVADDTESDEMPDGATLRRDGETVDGVTDRAADPDFGSGSGPGRNG